MMADAVEDAPASHRFGPRTGVLSGLILAAALVAMLLELPLAFGVSVVLGTWAVVSLGEIFLSRRETARAAAAPRVPTAEQPLQPEPGAAEIECEPDQRAVAPEEREPPREWNVWELERRVRERLGEDPRRDEELVSLLLYLRRFATPDGTLPRDFDGLVRASFRDLIEVAR